MGQYVYLFRDAKRRPVYVGRGERIARAESHLAGTHNAGLESLIASGKFSVEAAGPYRDEHTARAVEAALISALDGSPGFANAAPGNAPRFAPLGVPAHLAARLDEPRLSLVQLGRLVGQRLGGGVLLVRLSSGGAFTSDTARAKYDPAAPDDAVIFENTIRWWWLRDLVAQWQAHPEQTPAVVAGLAGPPSRRYIAGSVLVDRKASWDLGNDPGYQVPTGALPTTAIDVDACGLRGRLVDGALFSQIKPGHFIWVDATGAVRYAPPRSLSPRAHPAGLPAGQGEGQREPAGHRVLRRDGLDLPYPRLRARPAISANTIVQQGPSCMPIPQRCLPSPGTRATGRKMLRRGL